MEIKIKNLFMLHKNWEQKVLSFIMKYWDKKGISPSQVEIAKGIGCSKQWVQVILERLREKGKIARRDGQFRSIKILSL